MKLFTLRDHRSRSRGEVQWLLVFPIRYRKLRNLWTVMNCWNLWLSIFWEQKTLANCAASGSPIRASIWSELEPKTPMLKVNLGSSNQVVFRNESPAVWPWENPFIHLQSYLSFLIEAKVPCLTTHVFVMHAIGLLTSHMKPHKIKT